MASSPASANFEAELGRIRHLSKNGLHLEALAAAVSLAVTAPSDRDLLYLTAANMRSLNRASEALAMLQRLEQQHPRYSLLYQERGYCHTTLRDAPGAIEAFQHAVNLNPALIASWSMLARLYRLTGDLNNAAIAEAQLSRLQILPPEIVRAASRFSDGDLSSAEHILREYLSTKGDHVEARRLLARILIRHQKYQSARDQLEKLLALDPDNREDYTLFAIVCVGLSDYHRAIALYRRLLSIAPNVPELHVSLGHSLKAIGQQSEATESYKTAAAIRPSFGDAWWSLANLKTYYFSPDEIARMSAEEAASSVDVVDRYHLCFALGKALEDRGDYEDSWQFYERGNALKRAEIRYRPEVNETNTREQIEVCTAQFFAAHANAGVSERGPIFIVGLPRSGSTLIEQILASHSQVQGTHELAEIPRIASELQRPLSELLSEDFARLGRRYLEDTSIYRDGKPFFIDKMPNNFRHVGLIHLMLPNATIIDVRREPMACCFSNLKQLFAQGQAFTHSIEDIARYYRNYLELMRHWDAVLPGRVLRVCYEDVIKDLENNVHRILEHCGLGLEAACLEFHKTKRCVSTASSEQVRRPIFRDGLFQWRNYEPWLAPLRDSLGDALTRYRD